MNIKSILKPIALGVSAMLLIGNSAADITEESLKDYLAKSIKASTTLNIDFLANTIAEEAEILVIPSCSYPTKDVIIISKKEYIGLGKVVKAMIEDFHYENRKLSKNISSDKMTANIIADVYSEMTLGGERIISKSQEMIELQEIEKKITVTKVSACEVNGEYPIHRLEKNESKEKKSGQAILETGDLITKIQNNTDPITNKSGELNNSDEWSDLAGVVHSETVTEVANILTVNETTTLGFDLTYTVNTTTGDSTITGTYVASDGTNFTNVSAQATFNPDGNGDGKLENATGTAIASTGESATFVSNSTNDGFVITYTDSNNTVRVLTVTDDAVVISNINNIVDINSDLALSKHKKHEYNSVEKIDTQERNFDISSDIINTDDIDELNKIFKNWKK